MPRKKETQKEMFETRIGKGEGYGGSSGGPRRRRRKGYSNNKEHESHSRGGGKKCVPNVEDLTGVESQNRGEGQTPLANGEKRNIKLAHVSGGKVPTENEWTNYKKKGRTRAEQGVPRGTEKESKKEGGTLSSLKKTEHAQGYQEDGSRLKPVSGKVHSENKKKNDRGKGRMISVHADRLQKTMPDTEHGAGKKLGGRSQADRLKRERPRILGKKRTRKSLQSDLRRKNQKPKKGKKVRAPREGGGSRRKRNNLSRKERGA